MGAHMAQKGDHFWIIDILAGVFLVAYSVFVDKKRPNVGICDRANND
jgi:hypothetical protein